jgi:hypothetical protein
MSNTSAGGKQWTWLDIGAGGIHGAVGSYTLYDSTDGLPAINFTNTVFTSYLAVTAPSFNGLTTPTAAGSATVAQTVCHGTVTIPATAIASAAKSAFTITCTGAVVGDTVSLDFDGGTDPSTLTGFLPSTSGTLTILKSVAANVINIVIENNTASSITPTAFQLDGRVIR